MMWSKRAEITGDPVEFSTFRPARNLRNVDFTTKGLFRSKSLPYNPLIAEERGAKRRRARKQATEITKKLAVSERRFQATDNLPVFEVR